MEFFDDGADFVCGYVVLVRFGVEVEENNGSWGQALVDDAVAATFAFANVAVLDADFVDNVIGKARDAIAWEVAILQLLDRGLQIGFDVAVAFFEVAGFTFEFGGDENLY